MLRPLMLPLLLLTAPALAGPLKLAAQARTSGDWPAYGHDGMGGRYSPLTMITPGNVARLMVAWRIHTGEAARGSASRWRSSFEATPIVRFGTMYLATPSGRVLALVPETGETRWIFDPGVNPGIHFGDNANRGVSAWVDPHAGSGEPCARRVFVATIDARLIALDAATGARCTGFGADGTVDLRQGLRNPPFETAEYEETSPPAVVRGLVIVGSGVADNNRFDAASGEVRAFDARSGVERWSWDPVPQNPRDPAYRTWQGPYAHRTGAGNVWSVIAVDSAMDLVILPTTSPSPDYYGGMRLGSNRYANSVVALRASSGKVVWAFQTVHHDLWDYDNASPPALVTVRHGGRDVPAVLQATKTGMLYVLDRRTGVPIIPVEERPVPASTVPGEQAWPTQPFSTLPTLSPQHFDPDSLFALSDSDRVACRQMITGLRNQGIFTPPSLEGTLVIPSNVGGAHWGGVAFDPVRQIAVVPVNRIAAVVQLIPEKGTDLDSLWAEGDKLGYETTRMRGTPYVMRRRFLLAPSRVPCTPPPFGALVAMDLTTGKEAWDVPLGDLGALYAGDSTGHARLASLGSPNLGGAVVTASGLVFIAATLDRLIHAFDIQTGRELWTAPLPAGGKATPMTFQGSDGRQYVVIAAGGDGEVFGKGDEVIAFALPQ